MKQNISPATAVIIVVVVAAVVAFAGWKMFLSRPAVQPGTSATTGGRNPVIEKLAGQKGSAGTPAPAAPEQDSGGGQSTGGVTPPAGQ